MTPTEFIEKWRHVELKERTASHSHFIDLCHLLDIKDPITADPKGEWFTFEKGASKTSGGEGWADVWRKDCFAWEYKGKRKDLDKAFSQLQQYAIALENPPLLIVSDMDQIRIHTNWTNTVQEVHKIPLEGLTDAANRDRLRHAFLDPERLKPSKTRQDVTEDVAKNFASLAQRLRDRGHDPEQVAHFVNRLVFCLFAEDVDLLPDKMFEKMLAAADRNPAQFADHAKTLFGAMNKGGMVGFEKVDHFNGGLFDDDTALPLLKADITDLRIAAGRNWSDIDPSILGTLFERGLDPSKRSQLGAHYTDRDKIMQIVNPVIVEPLMAEWADIRARMETLLANAPKATAQKLLRGKDLTASTKARNAAETLYIGFLERLRTFRVLDPACGSGNFLYISLLELKNIEHRVNLESEAMGFTRQIPRVGPESVLGIELNPYAAELARVSVWIGEIQWMRKNGFEAARNPILRTLNTIENRDAVLNADGTRAEWPKADVVVGNPPFLGSQKMIRELGQAYTDKLRSAWISNVPATSDLVTYWFAKAHEQISNNISGKVGFVATNSISELSNRKVMRKIADEGVIFNALSDEPWVVDGADVRVSLVCFCQKHDGKILLDDQLVEKIFSNLSSNNQGYDITTSRTLTENVNYCARGIETGGPFEIGREVFEKLASLPVNPNNISNSNVLLPLISSDSLTGRYPDEFVIDFSEWKYEGDAALFEGPFDELKTAYLSYGTNKKRKIVRRDKWWLHRRSGQNLRNFTKSKIRYLITPRVSKHRIFCWVNNPTLPDSRLFAFGASNDEIFGILSSHFHEIWTFATCSWHGVGNDPTYNAESCFETFPFPEGLTPNIPAAQYADDKRAQKIAVAAARLNELRENWLNPPDLIERVPEVVPGYPDRLLPKDAAAEAILKKRTLTNLYNQRPAWLDHAHKALDEAVAEAYGWGDDWRAGLLTDDEILARLFRLNQERAG